MTKYAVEVYEVYKKIVPIEADSEKEAEEKARGLWHKDKIKFEYTDGFGCIGRDFSNAEFICAGEWEE